MPALVVMPLCVALVSGGLLYLVFGSGMFALRDIRIHGGVKLPADSLRTVTAAFVGRNLITLPLAGMRESFMRMPRVKDVHFSRTLFDRLDCYVSEREPVALVAAGELYEIDDDGIVLDSGNGEVLDLPVITGISGKELGAGAGREKIDRALRVLRLFKMFGFDPATQLSEIHLEGSEVSLVWMTTGTVVFIGRDGFIDKMRKFKAYFGSLDESESFPELVDLRFDRQVVVR